MYAIEIVSRLQQICAWRCFERLSCRMGSPLKGADTSESKQLLLPPFVLLRKDYRLALAGEFRTEPGHALSSGMMTLNRFLYGYNQATSHSQRPPLARFGWLGPAHCHILTPVSTPSNSANEQGSKHAFDHLTMLRSSTPSPDLRSSPHSRETLLLRRNSSSSDLTTTTLDGFEDEDVFASSRLNQTRKHALPPAVRRLFELGWLPSVTISL